MNLKEGIIILFLLLVALNLTLGSITLWSAVFDGFRK